MPRANHERRPPRVAGAMPAQHVGDAVRNPIGMLGLALGRQAVRAKRVRGRPCPGSIDHRARQVAPRAGSRR